jgi:hypothetical protein
MEKDLRFEKLPKWAQREIEKLEMNVVYWKKKASVGPEDSDTFVSHYPDNDQPLGQGETIRFVLENGYVEVQNYDTHVSVRADDAIAIQPQSGNLVKVWNEGWKR